MNIISRIARIAMIVLGTFFIEHGYSQVRVEQDSDVGVGINNPRNDAKLDISSTNRGFLMPRINSTQLHLIPNPADGLQVFCPDLGSVCTFTTIPVGGQNGWQCASILSSPDQSITITGSGTPLDPYELFGPTGPASQTLSNVKALLTSTTPANNHNNLVNSPITVVDNLQLNNLSNLNFVIIDLVIESNANNNSNHNFDFRWRIKEDGQSAVIAEYIERCNAESGNNGCTITSSVSALINVAALNQLTLDIELEVIDTDDANAPSPDANITGKIKEIKVYSVGDVTVEALVGPPGQPGANGSDGTDGANGITPVINATVETIPGNQNSTVVVTGPIENRNFHFRIPAGLPGQNGTNGTNGSNANVDVVEGTGINVQEAINGNQSVYTISSDLTPAANEGLFINNLSNGSFIGINNNGITTSKIANNAVITSKIQPGLNNQVLTTTLTNGNPVTVWQLPADGNPANELQNINTNGNPGNITLSQGGGTLNLNVNDADASITNEGTLSVGPGGANSSTINSNTQGSPALTINGGTGINITETGNNITINNTGLLTEIDGVIGNEVTNATVNGGLVRAGAGNGTNNFTLGLPLTGVANGQVMKFNGTAWVVDNDVVGAGTVTNVTGVNPISVTSPTTTPVVSILPGTNGQILSTNNGNVTWQNPTFWELDGNENGDVNILGTTDQTPLRVYTGNTEKMRVTENGNLGIGTTTPANRLHVIDPTATFVAKFEGGNSSVITVGDTSLSGQSNTLYQNSTGQMWQGMDNAGTGVISTTAGAQGISLSTAGTEKMRILNNGNIGINVPQNDISARLDVGGDVIVRQRTGTPSKIATFDANGKLVEGGSVNGPVGQQFWFDNSVNFPNSITTPNKVNIGGTGEELGLFLADANINDVDNDGATNIALYRPVGNGRSGIILEGGSTNAAQIYHYGSQANTFSLGLPNSNTLTIKASTTKMDGVLRVGGGTKLSASIFPDSVRIHKPLKDASGDLGNASKVLSATADGSPNWVDFDGSANNELQTITSDGNPGNITLSNGGGTLNLNVNDADANPANEGAMTVTGTTTKTITSNTAGSVPVSITGGGIVNVGGAGNDITVTATEVDGNISNEGSLTVTGTTTKTITSNTSGSTPLTVTGAGIVEVGGTGNDMIITGTEVDGSITNEIQTLTLVGNIVSLSNGGGSITLPTDGDGNSTNELQTITTSGTAGNITLSNGGGTLNLNVNDADANPANEGAMTVTGAAIKTITSNTAGSTPVTITGGGITTVGGTGNAITITTTEADGSTVNELQTITTSGAAGNITLSNGGGTLNLNVNDADANPANEGAMTVTGAAIKTITSNTAGSTPVTITGGGITTVGGTGNAITITTTEADGSTVNELQTLSLTGGNVLNLSNGGGSITLPVLPAGTSTQTLYHNGSAWTATSVATVESTRFNIGGYAGTVNSGSKLLVNGGIQNTSSGFQATALKGRDAQNGDTNMSLGSGFSITTGTLNFTEADGSTTNEIELPSQSGHNGKVLATNGTTAYWTNLPGPISNGRYYNSGVNTFNTSTTASTLVPLSTGGGYNITLGSNAFTIIDAGVYEVSFDASIVAASNTMKYEFNFFKNNVEITNGPPAKAVYFPTVGPSGATENRNNVTLTWILQLNATDKIDVRVKPTASATTGNSITSGTFLAKKISSL